MSHDGKRLTVFQLVAGRTVLSILTRDGAVAMRRTTLPLGFICLNPRWSPDDRWIAFQRSDPAEFNHYVAENRETSHEATPYKGWRGVPMVQAWFTAPPKAVQSCTPR